MVFYYLMCLLLVIIRASIAVDLVNLLAHHFQQVTQRRVEAICCALNEFEQQESQDKEEQNDGLD